MERLTSRIPRARHIVSRFVYDLAELPVSLTLLSSWPKIHTVILQAAVSPSRLNAYEPRASACSGAVFCDVLRWQGGGAADFLGVYCRRTACGSCDGVW